MRGQQCLILKIMLKQKIEHSRPQNESATMLAAAYRINFTNQT